MEGRKERKKGTNERTGEAVRLGMASRLLASLRARGGGGGCKGDRPNERERTAFISQLSCKRAGPQGTPHSTGRTTVGNADLEKGRAGSDIVFQIETLK